MRVLHVQSQVWVRSLGGGNKANRLLLEGAVGSAPERVVVLVQTIVQLPFGPLAAEVSAEQTDLWSNALSELLSEPSVYEDCSRRSREAALRLVARIDAVSFEELLGDFAVPG